MIYEYIYCNRRSSTIFLSYCIVDCNALWIPMGFDAYTI